MRMPVPSKSSADTNGPADRSLLPATCEGFGMNGRGGWSGFCCSTDEPTVEVAIKFRMMNAGSRAVSGIIERRECVSDAANGEAQFSPTIPTTSRLCFAKTRQARKCGKIVDCMVFSV